MHRQRVFFIGHLTICLSILAAGVFSVRSTAQQGLAPYREVIPGTEIGFEMVPIPGGTFLMGSDPSEKGHREEEGPRHRVRLEPFWMGRHEVTWDEYDQFAFGTQLPSPPSPATGSDQIVSRPTPPYADEAHGYGKGRQPAISMTYHAANEYCRWLSLKTGKTYRLPTEAEWEYAARAETTTAYSFGDDPALLPDHAWLTTNSDYRPHPVGRKKPNPWGLFDLHGNVAEWCLDAYDPLRYQTRDLQRVAERPILLAGEKRYSHVVRGGSWDDEGGRLRSAARGHSEKDWSLRDPQDPQSIWWHTEAIMVGFRVVRPVEEQGELVGWRSKITRQSPNE
jgi:formylglycine-generating enzyme required for sulfatase activity